MKTLPLWPRVIRISSSTYRVLSQPVGPIKPNGKVTSMGDSCSVNRHLSNLTSIFLLSSGLIDPLTSTVMKPLDLPFLLKRGVGLLAWNATTFRILPVFKLIDWVLLILFVWLFPSSFSVMRRPMSSSPSCKFYGRKLKGMMVRCNRIRSFDKSVPYSIRFVFHTCGKMGLDLPMGLLL